MGLLSSILQGLGFAADIYENTRTTETNVKSNKPSERKYDFDDGTGYTEKDFLEERKRSKKSKNNNSKVSPNKNKSNDGREGR